MAGEAGEAAPGAVAALQGCVDALQASVGTTFKRMSDSLASSVAMMQSMNAAMEHYVREGLRVRARWAPPPPDAAAPRRVLVAVTNATRLPLQDVRVVVDLVAAGDAPSAAQPAGAETPPPRPAPAPESAPAPAPAPERAEQPQAQQAQSPALSQSGDASPRACASKNDGESNSDNHSAYPVEADSLAPGPGPNTQLLDQTLAQVGPGETVDLELEAPWPAAPAKFWAALRVTSSFPSPGTGEALEGAESFPVSVADQFTFAETSAEAQDAAGSATAVVETHAGAVRRFLHIAPLAGICLPSTFAPAPQERLPVTITIRSAPAATAASPDAVEVAFSSHELDRAALAALCADLLAVAADP